MTLLPCLARVWIELLVLLGPFWSEPIVSLEAGKVSGVVLDEAAGLRVFRGIPYAAPPVGPLRWRPPQPVAPWEGVRPAQSFASPCPQSPLIAMLSMETLPATSEDCLTLNVWSSARSEDERRPVLVWLHGGGFIGGWASQRLYDGAAFARRGLVFVSVNYRLGPLGLFAHPELAAERKPDDLAGENLWLLDQIAALRWIRANVAALGGDPGRVTLLGESAGGTSVIALCASPLARGLFHGAIAHSPWLDEDLFVSRDAAESLGREYARQLLGDAAEGALERLRALPADELWQHLGARFEARIVIGGADLPEHPEDAFAGGRQARVPLVAGTTVDEGSVFLELLPVRTSEAYASWLTTEFGASAAEVRALYPGEDASGVAAALAQLVTDRWFLCPTRSLLRAHAAVGESAWQYLFTRTDPRAPELGAHHAVELPHLFGTLPPDAGAYDRELSTRMLDAWTRFATSGDPNGPGLVTWPPYARGREPHLVLGEPITLGASLRTEACDLRDAQRAEARR
jgi:para-nitrobenzyl esterase